MQGKTYTVPERPLSKGEKLFNIRRHQAYENMTAVQKRDTPRFNIHRGVQTPYTDKTAHKPKPSHPWISKSENMPVFGMSDEKINALLHE
jgi:hypothetical protein